MLFLGMTVYGAWKPPPLDFGNYSHTEVTLRPPGSLTYFQRVDLADIAPVGT